jgi:hypothetical protein
VTHRGYVASAGVVRAFSAPHSWLPFTVPTPSAPFFKKFNAPAEYREGFSTCSDCGGALAAGSAPALASAVVPTEPTAELTASLPRAEGTSGDFVRRVAISLAALAAAALSHMVLLPPAWIPSSSRPSSRLERPWAAACH